MPIRNHPKRSSKLFLLPGDSKMINSASAAAVVVAQSVRGSAPQAEGWMFEFQPRQTQVVKTGSDRFSDRFTVKRSAIVVSGTGLGETDA